GDEKFWAYLDRLTEITPTNNNLNLDELPKIAEYIGLDVKAFNTCLTSGKNADKIEQHVQNAQDTGARGTPWSIVVAPNGTK
ncbi:DsbA family protein, partial [Helicobacter pylori]|uniref:DsbA family protein n=1 Tax=Helicobacter pylori TaxID=210 RepID=UPI002928A9A4